MTNAWNWSRQYLKKMKPSLQCFGFFMTNAIFVHLNQSARLQENLNSLESWYNCALFQNKCSRGGSLEHKGTEWRWKKKYTTRIRNEDIYKKNYVCFYVLVQFSFHFNSNLFRSALLPEIKNKTQKSVFVITQIKGKKIRKVCVS